INMYVVKQNGLLLKCAANLFESDEMAYNICLEAIKQNGFAIEYVYGWLFEPENRKLYKQLCYEAVKQNGLVLNIIDPIYHTIKMYAIAIKQDLDINNISSLCHIDIDEVNKYIENSVHN